MAGRLTVAAAMMQAGVVLSQPVVSTTPSSGIAVEDFDQAEIGEVAVERRRRPLAGLLDRVDGKLHGEAAGGRDAVAHALGEFEVVAVARREVGAGLGDADDRLAGLQFLAGQAEIEVALEIERRHAGIFGIVEPELRAQLHVLFFAILSLPISACWLAWSCPASGTYHLVSRLSM